MKRLHRNAQRLLKPVLVSNPFARSLTFLNDTTRTRRDHKKYLSLIRSIACLRQHQRAVKTTSGRGRPEPYIEVTLEDIELANRLADEVLGRSLDELPPQTRRFLDMLEAFVAQRGEAIGARRDELRFSRREVREATGWTYFQVRVHLDRLVELEYVLARRGGRGQSFEYELLYDGKGKDGKAFLVGLIDVEALGKQSGLAVTTETLRGRQTGLRGFEEAFEGPLSPPSARFEPGLRGGGNGSKAASHQAFESLAAESPAKTLIPGNGKKLPSNRYAGRSLSADGAAKKEAAASLADAAAEQQGLQL